MGMTRARLRNGIFEFRCRLWRAGLWPHPVSAACREQISGWVQQELSPWLDAGQDAHRLATELERLNHSNPDIAMFTVSGRHVKLVPKPGGFSSPMQAERAGYYLRHLNEAMRMSKRGVDTVLAVFTADGALDAAGIPVFSFQKPRGHRAILLPDVDFILNDYYASKKYVDNLPYSRKTNTASFTGATSGSGSLADSPSITAENARTLAWPPRLKSFAYFRSNPRVSFRLPVIVQCDSPETVAILESQGCGSGMEKFRMSWQKQFSGRFIISMDGNGATCSRVAIALKSRCALMKYDSDSQLYYFHGLRPGHHYLAIAADEDVEKILDREEGGDSSAAVAAAGREFAESFLTRDAVLAYTCRMLETYAERVFASAR